MSQEWIINDAGEIYDPQSARFRRHIGSDLSFDVTRDVLVTQMGYIHIVAHPLCPRVVFRAAAVTASAVAGMIGWAIDSAANRIVHTDPDLPHQPTLVQRTQLPTYVSGLGSHLDLKQNPLAQEVALNFSRFAKIWEPVQIIATANIDEATRLRAIGALLGDLFVIAERSPSTGRYVIKHNGTKFRNYNKHIGQLREGLPFETLEARSYGKWLADTLAPLGPQFKPKAELIQAVVGTTNSEPLLLRYSRMVIPYSYGGVDHLLTGSIVH